jgi:ABC-2 type transport system permease protein
MLKEYLIIPHYSNLLLTIPFLIVAFFQRYFISLIIATFAFWIDQSKALIHLKWMAEGVVGGGWLPLLYFPQWFQKIASFTPFYYWYHVPITILLNPTSLIQVLVYLIQGLAWTLVLWLMHLYFWKKGINKYSAVGS